MRRLFLLYLFFLPGLLVNAQGDSLLHWQASARKIANGLYEIRASTAIPAGWYMYGSNPGIEGLENIKILPSYENALMQGQPAAGNASQRADDATFGKVNVFTGSVTITQQVKINGFVPATLKGVITSYLGKTGEFITSEQPFEIVLEGGAAASEASQRIRISAVDIDHPLQD